ncbi:MAG TPA: hypothetical protein VD999_02130 [Vitreimonas sp.]|nr:hypothetical protein [Vitreimonas sp.]
MDQAVLNHIARNTVPANNSVIKCVDGRYTTDQDQGAVARPGADAGYSEALLKIKKDRPELNIGVDQAFQWVYDFAQSQGRQYAWHTDQHVDPIESDHHAAGEGPIVGCGHCAKAVMFADRYGVEAEDIKQLVALLRKSIEDGAAHPTHLVNLGGDHAEVGVLQVMGTQKTVNSWDADEPSSQFFIYDRTRDEKMVAELEKFIMAQGIALTPGELLAALDAQTGVTLDLLAKGKNVYTVNVDGTEPEVALAMTI